MHYRFKKPVHGTIGNEKYQCTIEWRNGKFIADEPEATGGKDFGPDPYTLLVSSLASCTLVTLRMYIDHKGWAIPDISVDVNMYQEIKDEKTITIIDRDIVFLTPIEEEQKNRLLEVAKSCPISQILQGEIQVRTFLFKDGEIEKQIKYPNEEITVVWKPALCQHAARCWSQLPKVFDYKKKKWINADGASSEKIIEQISKCPSGALSYYLNSDSNKQSQYSSLTEAIDSLKQEGYIEDFNLRTDCIETPDGRHKILDNEFSIDKYFRFDVDSDPADQSILYAISSDKYKLKGILVNSYGIYSEPITNQMLEKLKITTKSNEQ